MTDLWCTRMGVIAYPEATELQARLRDARRGGEIPDTLLLLEHYPVYTKGRRTEPGELPMGRQWYEMQGIQVCETDRGGRVTYHGPGQLVGYPIVDLKPYRDDVHDFVRRMERVMIAALADHGIPAATIDGLTGVWTEGERPDDPDFIGSPQAARKIGSIGIHVSHGVTTHGFAINVANDLQPFEWIVPCGIEAVRMTSVTKELGAEHDLASFTETVIARFGEIYERNPVSVPAERITALGAVAAE